METVHGEAHTKQDFTRYYTKQKQAARAIFFEDKYTHAKTLLEMMNALYVYQTNVLKHLCFMHSYTKKMRPLLRLKTASP